MSDDSTEMKLSIGAVSRETDIPAATLRTWERRYGFPDPERNDSGHRVYCRDTIDRLQLTSRALQAGYRPSNVVGMTEEQLRELLGTADLSKLSEELEAELSDTLDSHDRWLSDWLEAAVELDGKRLQRFFRDAWNRLGPVDFICERAAPFMVSVGEAWARDQLKIVHEHFTSEYLRDFLTARWRRRSEDSNGPGAVLATPEGESHAIGLHLVAVLLAVAGWHLVFLGPNTPVDDVLEAAEDDAIEAVAISISESYSSGRAETYLERLVGNLPPDVQVVTGGKGTPSVEGTLELRQLRELYEWAFDRAN